MFTQQCRVNNDEVLKKFWVTSKSVFPKTRPKARTTASEKYKIQIHFLTLQGFLSSFERKFCAVTHMKLQQFEDVIL